MLPAQLITASGSLSRPVFESVNPDPLGTLPLSYSGSMNARRIALGDGLRGRAVERQGRLLRN